MTTEARRTLVAGVGNIFLGDDGFGVETVRRLIAEGLPDHVEAVDIGVRGVHLAYQLLDGYDTFVLVDATARGGAPGTLYVIEPDGAESVEPGPGTGAGLGTGSGSGSGSGSGEALLDGHRMSPDSVLALLGTLCAGTGGTPPRRIVVVGCEPSDVEEGIGLSPAVEAAVPEAVRLVLGLLDRNQERNTSPC